MGLLVIFSGVDTTVACIHSIIHNGENSRIVDLGLYALTAPNATAAKYLDELNFGFFLLSLFARPKRDEKGRP